MIVVGIDPGYERLGYAFLSVEKKSSFKVLDCGVIVTKASDHFLERLSILDFDLKALMNRYCCNLKKAVPCEAAVEKIFFTKNQTTAMKVSEARGVVLLNLYRCGALITEYTPLEMKKMIAGSGRASKERVMHMLTKLVPDVKLIKEDNAADALALALCHCFSLNSPLARWKEKEATKEGKEKRSVRLH